MKQVVRPTGEVVAGGRPLGPGEADGLGILHADLDAFYASVEVLKDPSLRGRPLLVGGTGGRGVVTSASYEARAFGCRNAMPMARARRLCPSAVAIPPDFAAYRHWSATVMRIFQSLTPLVEPLALDEAFLDVRGARALFGDAVATARLLRARVREEAGLALTVGVAANKYLAKLASTRGKPDGLLVVPPGRALEFLHPLPVDALWGAGQATIETLARYGLRTVGDVAATPRATLERALGPAAGAQLHQLAWARDDREVVPFEAAKSVGSEETFAADIDDPTQLAREVLRCCVRVGRRLREAGLAGRTVTLKLRFADFRTITRGRTLPVATDTDTELHEVAAELLARLQLGRAAVRLVGVTVSNLQRQGAPVQLRLGPERPGWEAAVRAADAVRARFGDGAIDLASLTGDRPAEAYQEARQTPRPRRTPLLPPTPNRSLRSKLFGPRESPQNVPSGVAGWAFAGYTRRTTTVRPWPEPHMPLSEHEQRILAEIERRLLEEDPKFAHQVGSTFRAHLGRRLKLAVAGFIVGLVVVISSTFLENVAVGVAGFVIMLAAVFVFVRTMRRRATVEGPVAGPAPPASSAPTGQRRQGTSPKGGIDAWWGRMTERWRSRWEERGGQGPP